MTLRVLSIFGTRPEAVKMAPIVRLLKQTKDIESRVAGSPKPTHIDENGKKK